MVEQNRLCRVEPEIALADIAAPLLEWYGENARILPWRSKPTPYGTWVSEIMLQQTRVETVIPYYLRFVKALPDIRALAGVFSDELMKLWQGLGYYSRARNMQKTALIIQEKYGGKLPKTASALIKLPGIGPYTAGAIASIAFGEAVPAVDGNVLRVLARLRADGRDITVPRVKKDVAAELAVQYRAVIPALAAQKAGSNPAGDLNQAWMDLGAKICIPGARPLCGFCPLEFRCRSRKAGIQEELPRRSPLKSRRGRKLTVLVQLFGGQAALVRRPDAGLLAGLWEFPNVDGHLTEKEAIQFVSEQGASVVEIRPLSPAKHIFTHKEWQMKGWALFLDRPPDRTDLRWADPGEIIREFAVPSAFAPYLAQLAELLP
jgi:A/G-specific adenine glycosylase